jgi:hypothetical protein
LPIENRAYGPDCSAEERAELAARVWSPEERIVVLEELSIPSVFTIDLMSARLDDITKGWTQFCFLIDLTHAGYRNLTVHVDRESALEDLRRALGR